LRLDNWRGSWRRAAGARAEREHGAENRRERQRDRGVRDHCHVRLENVGNVV
jgi:hypothetical protein